jgi:hypothetical protein
MIQWLRNTSRVRALENKVESLSSSIDRLNERHYELVAQHARLLAHLKLYEHKEPAKTELRKGNPPPPKYEHGLHPAYNQRLGQ